MIVWVSEVPNLGLLVTEADVSTTCVEAIIRTFLDSFVDFCTGCENVSVVSSSIQSYTYSTY